LDLSKISNLKNRRVAVATGSRGVDIIALIVKEDAKVLERGFCLNFDSKGELQKLQQNIS
jgi:hypothetical protein